MARLFEKRKLEPRLQNIFQQCRELKNVNPGNLFQFFIINIDFYGAIPRVLKSLQ